MPQKVVDSEASKITMSFPIPSSQRAVQQDQIGRLRLVDDAAIPTLLPGYALVKTHAVALNPSDHKISHNFPLPGAYCGTDFSGTIVQLAPPASDADSVPSQWKVGDMVCGAAFCFAAQHRLASGAFAEYVRVRADLLLRVPNSPSSSTTMGPLEAATLMTALSTCLLAFWTPDALDLIGTPETPLVSEKPVPVLVYGGSTATGTIAIQLLKLSGYDPIATCSPRNFALVRGRGASAVFDHLAPNVAASIKSHTNGRLKFVLDCISTPESVTVCYDAIQRPGGRYASLEVIQPAELLAKRKAVRPKFVLAAEALGEEIALGQEDYDRPADRDKYVFAARQLAMLQSLLDGGQLRAHPTEVLQGGLPDVVGGLERLATGGVSGKKLVAVVE